MLKIIILNLFRYMILFLMQHSLSQLLFYDKMYLRWYKISSNRSPIIINTFLSSINNSFLLRLIELSRALIFIFIFIQWKQETYLNVYICNFYCILYILHICKHICNIYQSVANKLIGESSSKRFWNSAKATLVIVKYYYSILYIWFRWCKIKHFHCQHQLLA